MSQIQAGQSWVCNERRSKEPEHVWKNNPVGSQYVRFNVVVNSVDSGYVELTVTRSNPHISSPDSGDTIATTVDALQNKPKWVQNHG